MKSFLGIALILIGIVYILSAFGVVHLGIDGMMILSGIIPILAGIGFMLPSEK